MSQKEFENRIIKLQNSLLGFARSLTHNEEDAKDLLQETSLKALSNPSKYHEGNLKGWLCTIMRNLFLNDCRQASHREFHFPDFTVGEENISSTQGDETFSSTDVARIMSILSPDNRRIFSLYLQGYHYDEIAQRLKLPLSTIKTRIFRIKQELQAHRKEIL